MVSTSGHQPEPGGSRVQPWALGVTLLTHPSGLHPVSLSALGVSSGRIAPRRVGMVWAGMSLAFHTPPLHGQGVPEIIRAGWGEKTGKQMMFRNTARRFSQADLPALLYQLAPKHQRKSSSSVLTG